MVKIMRKYQKYFLKIVEKYDLTKIFAVYFNFTKNAISDLQLNEPFKIQTRSGTRPFNKAKKQN